MTALLRVDDLKVAFGSEAGRVDAVQGLSFEIERGKTLAIVGESGSGKSASALAVMGLLPDSAQISGSARLGGRELLGLGDREMSAVRGSEIAMVFQDPLSSLTPVFTVGAQIVEALQAHRSMSAAAARARALELLDAVGIPDPAARSQAYPHQLSGGQRQRVVIAMAIANEPDLIIADEPTTALDVTVAAQVLKLLTTLQHETDAGLLLITHDFGVVARVADDVVVMRDGKAVESAPVLDLFDHPQDPYTVRLLDAVPRIDGPMLGGLDTPDSQARRALDHPDEALDSPGLDTPSRLAPRRHSTTQDAALDHPDEPLDDPVPDDSPRDRQFVLTVANLTKTFAVTSRFLRRRTGEVHAVRGVSFDLAAGETLAIVGESGSGKSTTLHEIMSFGQPPGVIRIGDVDPAALRGREARTLRRQISMVFQDPAGALNPRMTARDLVAEPLRVTGASSQQAYARVAELLEQVGLDPDHGDRFPRAFSGGQRQRLAIARALATSPEVIALDEPLSALDVSIQADILELLRTVQQQTGVAYLLVAHDLAVVRRVAHRVAVMKAGEFVETGTTAEVFDHPQHPYTRELIAAVPPLDPRRARIEVPA
ncbi:putative peptide ABC transporter ATP-binding protein [Gordonia araii NBRC 100433]|uniref:Putative peptide ABC transporter ATP-binding protein n=1 Tax=Gordonia araii NBRC 100433 TaxID=1073574 RepID=G7GYG5_9ACTN|nr:ABC transporter ATP-binding protein [Gordonia araii]NNG97363.1 ABC transporter ATP-binding protein [Gordonia araii NBRC 100433]GAB08640.1 putative peptide ABC transporter ATP-binding protein [Gordonia araii NBRC 100433]